MNDSARETLGAPARRVADAIAFVDGRAAIATPDLARLLGEMLALSHAARREAADDLLGIAARAQRLAGDTAAELVGQLSALAFVVEAGPDRAATASGYDAAVARLLGRDASARPKERSGGVDLLTLRSGRSSTRGSK